MTTPSHSSTGSDGGTAKGRRQSMNGPDDTAPLDRNLRGTDAAARGEFVDDHQRDRDSKGVREGYDDSLRTRRDERDGHDYRGVARGD